MVWQHEQEQAAQPHPIDGRHRPPEDRSAVGRPRKRGDALTRTARGSPGLIAETVPPNLAAVTHACWFVRVNA